MPRSSTPTVADELALAHRVIPEMQPSMLKADLRNPENVDCLAEIGGCLFRARSWLGWNLEQVAAKLKRDPRQVRRWEAGEERTQVDVVFAVPELREPFCVQLAKLSGADVSVHVDFRRTA